MLSFVASNLGFGRLELARELRCSSGPCGTSSPTHDRSVDIEHLLIPGSSRLNIGDSGHRDEVGSKRSQRRHGEKGSQIQSEGMLNNNNESMTQHQRMNAK